METKRKALGKGLEQLFSNEVIDFDNFEKKIVNETKESDIVEIPLTEIRSNPYQPRKEFDEKSLSEFAESIKEHGVIQPIIVKKSIKGYELIAGERRTRASKMAGKDTIQEEAARKFGKSRSYITNILGLLTLPEKTKRFVQEGKITMGHARVLSKLSDPDQIDELANQIIENGLSVRETEKITSTTELPKKNKIKNI